MIRVWVYEGRNALMRLRPNCLTDVVPERIDFARPDGHPLHLVFGSTSEGERFVLGEAAQRRDLIRLGFTPFHGPGSPEHAWNLALLTEEWRRVASFYQPMTVVRSLTRRNR